jgi:hypothetical protein
VSDAYAAALREQGGLLAELADELAAERPPAPGPAQAAAAGPRAAGREAEYELLLELILAGSRLHYQASALEPDVSLLLGDQLYALGLSRLAALGDLEAVAELADVISLIAQAHAAGDPELAEAVWAAGATAIGWGAAPGHERAKALARRGDHRAAKALRAGAARS